MFDPKRLTRRDFVKGAGAAGAWLVLGPGGRGAPIPLPRENSVIFRADNCPVHDNEMRHRGVDALLNRLAAGGTRLFQTASPHPWGAADGLIAAGDVVVIKVNCQWKCRGTTNTDVVRGLIHRILQHPDGFEGEIVIMENGQGQGAFNGDPNAWGSYSSWPQIDNGVWINAEEENVLTVNHLVSSVFAGFPVSSFLLDPIRTTFITDSDHATNGYRKVDDVSYPCFTTALGRRVELKEGIWTGSGHTDNLKLINIPVFKDHDGTGITGALKHTYGIVSMSDGSSSKRHYSQSGTQCGKMFVLVRPPVLNIVDAIWVSHESLCGYPPDTTARTNMLLAGIDPVALDYHASKHILYPQGGYLQYRHDPDSYSGLINHLSGAMDFINANGGIFGHMSNRTDDAIDVVLGDAGSEPSPDIKANGSDSTVTIASGSPVTVTISLIAAGLAGQRAEGWVFAKTPFGWWSYSASGWRPGFQRFYNGVAGDLAPLQVLDMALPAGSYTFYFVVDDEENGQLQAKWWDSVDVRVV